MRKALSLFLAAFMVAALPSALRAEDGLDDLFDEDVNVVDVMDDDDDDVGPVYRRFGRDDDDRGPRHRFGPRHGPGFGPGPMMMRHHGDRDNRGDFDRSSGPRMGKGMKKWDRIDLTADQKKQLIDLKSAQYKDRLTAQMEMREAAMVLRDLRRSGNASEQDIIAAHQAMGAARGKLEALRYKQRDAFKQILTPEQLEKFETRDRPDRDRDGRPGDRPGRMGPRHPMGGPGQGMGVPPKK